MQGSSAPGRRRLAPVLSVTLVAVLLSSAGGMAADHFSDVPDDHRFAVEIGWLVSEGVTTGFEDGTFRPTNPVTRQAMAAFLHRYTTGTPADPGPDPAHPRAGDNWELLGCTNEAGTCRYPPGAWVELETRGALAQRCQLWDYTVIPHRCLISGGALGVLDPSGERATPGQDKYTEGRVRIDEGGLAIIYMFPLHQDAPRGLWTGRLCDAMGYSADCTTLLTVHFEVAD